MNPSNSLTIYGLRIRIGIAPTLTGTPPEGEVLNPHNMSLIGVHLWLNCPFYVECNLLSRTQEAVNGYPAVDPLHILAHGVALLAIGDWGLPIGD